jgi:hypothetical protein
VLRSFSYFAARPTVHFLLTSLHSTFCFSSQQDNNRGSPMTLVKLYGGMSHHQCQMIDSDSFGGVPKCRYSKVFSELCHFLLESCDSVYSALVFPGRGLIPVNEATIHRVMGNPMGATTIDCNIDALNLEFRRAANQKFHSWQR